MWNGIKKKKYRNMEHGNEIKPVENPQEKHKKCHADKLNERDIELREAIRKMPCTEIKGCIIKR
jgi:hypothetical protein